MFNDAEALKDLGGIVHPAVGVEIARRLGGVGDTDAVVVLDVPLLVESGRDDLAALVVVDVDPELAVARLVEQRGMREADARARIARQATREERAREGRRGHRQLGNGAGARAAGRRGLGAAPRPRGVDRSARRRSGTGGGDPPTTPAPWRCSRSCGRRRRSGTSSATRASVPAGRTPSSCCRPASSCCGQVPSCRSGSSRSPVSCRSGTRHRCTGNHWVLSGFVDLALLGALAVCAWPSRRAEPSDVVRRFVPAARLCLIVGYAFAAFSKLNSSFLDPDVSCATYFFRDTTDFLGLPEQLVDGTGWVPRAVVLSALAIELSIPVLLVIRRTRNLGVMVGLLFHYVLALDRTNHVFDFSSMLFALFVLFLPPTAGAWASERVGSVRARLALIGEDVPRRVHLVLVAVPVSAGLLVAAEAIAVDTAVTLAWTAWLVYGAVCVFATARFLRQRPAAEAGPDPPAPPCGVPAGPAPRGGQRVHPLPRAEVELRLEHVLQPPHRRRRVEPPPRPAHVPVERHPGRPGGDRQHGRPGPRGLRRS